MKYTRNSRHTIRAVRSYDPLATYDWPAPGYYISSKGLLNSHPSRGEEIMTTDQKGPLTIFSFISWKPKEDDYLSSLTVP